MSQQGDPTTDFQVESSIDRVLIELPQRNLGQERVTIGWIMTGFGFFITAFLLVWTLGMTIPGLVVVAQGDWFGIPFVIIGLFGLFGLVQAQKLLAGGITVLRNRTRCSIEITPDRILSTEHLMWTRFRRKTPVTQIAKLVVALWKEPTGAPKSGGLVGLVSDHVGVLSATLTNGKAKHLAFAYPHATIERLSEVVQREIGRLSGQSIPVDFVEKGSTGSAAALVGGDLEISDTVGGAPLRPVSKPANCQIEQVEMRGTTAFKIPPKGLVKGSHGLFPFAIFWTVFALVIGSVFFFAMDFQEEGMVVLFPLGIVSLFVVVGIAMLIGGINMGTRSVMIGVADGLLFWERKSIFGTKWQEIAAEEVQQVGVGPSGMSVNDVPIMQLSITTRDGRQLGMLSQLTNAELEWLAWELNEALGLVPDPEEPSAGQTQDSSVVPSEGESDTDPDPT